MTARSHCPEGSPATDASPLVRPAQSPSSARAPTRPSHGHLHTGVLLLTLTLLNLCSPTQQLDFSIEKLLEYNSLASCIGQIHKDFEECNTRGAEKAKSYMANVELNSEWTKRIKCCGTWKLRDCWMKAALKKCTRAQADQVFKLPYLFMPGLEAECSDYTVESGRCSFPMWLLILAISLSVFILVTCCSTIAYCIRRYRRRRNLRQVSAKKNRIHTVSSVLQNGNSKHAIPNSYATSEECRSLNSADKQSV